MIEYRIIPNKNSTNRHTVYRKSFIFFWKEVGVFDTYQSKVPVLEQAFLFVQSKKHIHFEA